MSDATPDRAAAAPADGSSASPDGRAIWDELTGQSEAVALLAAASSPRATARDAAGTALAHSWLITGP
ncbi:DNA polymerase III subunit delta', partial [Clavibacter michiganensis]